MATRCLSVRPYWFFMFDRFVYSRLRLKDLLHDDRQPPPAEEGHQMWSKASGEKTSRALRRFFFSFLCVKNRFSLKWDETEKNWSWRQIHSITYQSINQFIDHLSPVQALSLSRPELVQTWSPIINQDSFTPPPPPPPATDLLDILIQANRSWLRPHRKHLADITDEDITSQVKRSNRTASTVCVCVFILTDRQTGESTGVSLRSRSHMIPSDWSDWRHGSETRSPRTRGG